MQPFFRTLLAAILFLAPHAVAAQGAAVFLDIPTDARSAAMGGAGTALSADAFSAFRNTAQLPFAEMRVGGGYTYLPWMRNLIPETTLHASALYFKPNERQAVSLGFRHFTQYGSEHTDDNGNVLGRLRPRDMAFDIGYSRIVAKGLSIALTGRYIRSDAGTGHAENTFAFDAGLFYRRALFRSHVLTFGFQAANFGGDIDYGGGRHSLPWQLKAGSAVDFALVQAHHLTLTAEAGYRLRPTEARAWSGRFGAEYRCYGIATLRGGYCLGDRSAGEQRYGSVGAGVRWKYVAADAACLLAGKDSPLHKTWMLTVLFNW